VQVEALAPQLLDDLPGPGHPLMLRPLTSRRDLPQIDPIPADMQVFRVLMHARHLNRRHQLDPDLLGGLGRILHSRDRIVVGESEGRDSRLRRSSNHVRRQQLPIGNRRMTLQLDQHLNDLHD